MCLISSNEKNATKVSKEKIRKIATVIIAIKRAIMKQTSWHAEKGKWSNITKSLEKDNCNCNTILKKRTLDYENRKRIYIYFPYIDTFREIKF